MFLDVLPRWERCAYWTVGVLGVAYIIYSMFCEEEKFTNNTSFSRIWISGEKGKRARSTEWSMWLEVVWNLVVMNTIHVIISQSCCLFKISLRTRTWLLLIFDSLAVCFLLNAKTWLLQLSFVLFMYMVSLTGKVSLVWLYTLTCIVSMLNESTAYFQVDYLLVLDGIKANLYFVCNSLMCLRMTSFALEKIKYKQSKANIKSDKNGESCVSKPECKSLEYDPAPGTSFKDERSVPSRLVTPMDVVDSEPVLLDLLFYSFYCPVFLCGPVIIYSDFHSQVKASFRSLVCVKDLPDIAKQFTKITFYSLIIDCLFDGLYVRQHGSPEEVFDSVSVTALWGIIYYDFMLFIFAYYIIFGVTIQFSRFDGVAPLPPPRCVFWAYSSACVWKHLDVGLSNFLKTAVFIPLGGSRNGLARQISALGLTFLFSMLWHGASTSMAVVCLGSYVGTIVDTFVERSVLTSELIRRRSPAMRLRLKAILYCPSHLSGLILTVFFQFNINCGVITVYKMFWKASWATVIAELLFSMSIVHNSIYLSELYASRSRKNNSLHRG